MKILSISITEKKTKLPLPFLDARISAGFPSPAESYVDKKIDLNEELIKHPAATFFVRVEGDSMIGAGIKSGDILIVDRAIEPTHKKVVVAVIEGEFTVKRLVKREKKTYLVAENPSYPEIDVSKNADFSIWGVVIYAIHTL